jgi:hypothetical protein
MRFPILVACALFVGSLAFAGGKKDDMKPLPVDGRVVDLEISGQDRIVIVARGSDGGIERGWRATFLEGTSGKPLAGGEASIIRIDHRSTVLKTKLTPEQVRANRTVQFAPP